MVSSRGRPGAPPVDRQAKKPGPIGLPVRTLDDTALLLLWLAVIAGLVILAALGLVRFLR